MWFLGQIEHGIYVDECDGIHPDVINQYYGFEGKPVNHPSQTGQSGAGQPPDEGEDEDFDASHDNMEDDGDMDMDIDDEEDENDDLEDDESDMDEESEDSDDSDNMNEDGEDSGDSRNEEDSEGKDDDVDNENEDWKHIEGWLAEDLGQNFHHSPVGVPKHSAPFHEQTMADVLNGAVACLREDEIVPSGYGVLPDEWDDEGYPAYEIIRTGQRGLKQLWIALPDFVWRLRAKLWAQALHVMTRVVAVGEEVGQV